MNQDYLYMMRDIQDNILNFIENQYTNESDFNDFIIFLKVHNIHQNHANFKVFLQLIDKISNNHHRIPGFFDKIDRILNSFKDDIQKSFTNYQIFDIFKSNKRLLLYLLKSSIITPDEKIASVITNEKYSQFHYPCYFYPEFKRFYSKELLEKVENEKIFDERLIEIINTKFEIFERNRQDGENNDYVCQIIRNDSVNEFISFANQNNVLVTSNINESIFETNPFLLNRKLSLIDYAAFCGSFQIMKYLFHRAIMLSPNLLILAIHGQNSELIHLLEENSLKPSVDLYDLSFFEAIKCHHNDIAAYIENNFLSSENLNDCQIFSYSINNFNFNFFNADIEINSDIFYDFCRNGFYPLVDSLLKSSDIKVDLNVLRVFKLLSVNIVFFKNVVFIKFLLKSFIEF